MPPSPPAGPPAPDPAGAGAVSCPSCGTPASGQFCASCGAPLAGARCAGCGTALTPGAHFCHRCGTAVGELRPQLGGSHAPDGAGFSAALPWAVAGIALVALIALVAGQRFNTRSASADAPPTSVAAPSGAAGASGGPAPIRAPDISSMSPRQRANLLYDRIMRLHEAGQQDSVDFFAQMGLAAYQMLPTQSLDSRYDMGRIAEVAGAEPLAKSEADTILAARPTHLLGLALAMRVSHLVGDSAAARSYARRLIAAAPAERARKNVPEYQRHATDIDAALRQARSLVP